MRILIIGASKGTGALAVKTALERGHEVTAVARSPEKLELENPKLTKVKGDFHNNEDVESVVFTARVGSSMGRIVNPFRATRQALVRFKKAIPSCLATRYAASSAVVK